MHHCKLFHFLVNMLANCTLLYYKGFDVVVAEQALIVTKNQGVQPAMEWYDI